MDSISYVIQVVAAAALSVVPAPPATVPGTVEIVNVANSAIITQTADKLAFAHTAVTSKTATETATKKEEEKKTEEAKQEEAKTAEKEHLQLPLEAGKYAFTSDYGLRCAPVTGAGNFHYGIDLAAPNGTPMFSIADGTVTRVVDGVMGSQQGGDVQIESTINGKLMTIRYYHMANSSQYIKVGDKVKAGQHISDVGTTGMSTGPHLHLEVYEGHFSEQKHLDPEAYFKEIGFNVIEKAYANLVGQDSHPTSCPGGLSTEEPATPATIPAPPVNYASTETKPAAPASPAAPAPVTPSPTPVAPPTTQAPTAAPKPTPTPAPPATTAPAPVSTPSPSAIPSATPSYVQVPLPSLPVAVPTP